VWNCTKEECSIKMESPNICEMCIDCMVKAFNTNNKSDQTDRQKMQASNPDCFPLINIKEKVEFT